jgi:uncharacterized protein (TIGR03083 family)
VKNVASAAYKECRERIGGIAANLSPDDLNRTVPACPKWTVADLIAHLVGIAEDFGAGNFEKAGSDAWTKAQIARHSKPAMPALIDEWEAISGQLDQSLDEVRPGVAAMLIGDAVTHEHDLRGALNLPGARDTDAVWIALDRNVRRFGKRIKDAGLSSVVVRCEGREWQAGVLKPSVELEAARFELLRALTGRRTVQEIASLAWTGDPEPYIELVSSYPVARRSLKES